MKSILTVFVVLSFSLFLNSCSKDDAASKSTINVRLTDAPTALEEVNVDIRRVEIKYANDTTNVNDSTGFSVLNSFPGVYNLLALQNGIDTLIGTGVFATGYVKEIRLILGPNNTVKEGGQIYPLTIPSGSESGLKIKFNKKIQSTVENILIDFDAALSIKKENDGYKLRPVLKIK